MLISRASETNAKELKRQRAAERRKRDSPREYQTANELFEMMAKNHPFDENVNDSLSASDLVILYKNIEMGTKLMSEVGELKRRAPNQYVETIVYKEEGESDGSDFEAYSNDELHHAVLVNKERIDLLSNPPSLENTLCHKFGDLEMRASNISTQYDKHFLFKDPYIKEQLRNLSMLKPTSNVDNTMLPASLLDYICCKRLEDNYNFYMDNVIKYVKHTIDQLKRISNGDYLTDKAKEKWREVDGASQNIDNNNAKILTTSASIPLQVQQKVNGLATTWDDIIHSEVDIRSLSKILEKKIVVEIPKLICGSYKLFSQYCSDNLVFSCTTENQIKADPKKEDPRLDVVMQLGRSESGQVMSNISSIMVWQGNPSMPHDDFLKPALLPISYNEEPKVECEQEELPPKIIEIVDVKEESEIKDDSEVKEETDETEETHGTEETPDTEQTFVNKETEEKIESYIIEEPVQTSDDFQETIPEINQNQSMEGHNTSLNANHEANPYNNGFNDFDSSETSESLAHRDVSDMRVDPISTEAAFCYQTPESLMFSLQCMNMSSLPEESCEDAQKPMKRRSPTKVRVKSPYENKSHLIEERKRKKLLEIRERREKRKIAMGESCKISKHKYGKGPMPRPSSSVTKLSITNKSFYNSIYGQNVIDVEMQNKSKSGKEKKDLTLTPALEQLGCEQGSEMLSPDINNKKYINRSYFLDDAVTEIMYAEPSEGSSDVRELFSTSTSLVSSDLALSQTIDLTTSSSPCGKLERFDETQENREVLKNGVLAKSSLGNIPEDEASTSTKNEELWKDELKKTIPIECRKSIDKIYGLIRKLGSGDTLDCKSTRSKCTINSNKVETPGGKETSIQCSDSGTSLKHLLASSNASSFSFDKAPTVDNTNQKEDFGKKGNGLTTVVPKVIISTKQQPIKQEVDKVKKERKKVTINTVRVPENPLKAISQLLHEFDNVQKTRQKLSTYSKGNKKQEVSFDNRQIPRGSPTKNRTRLESYEVPKFENINEKTKALVHKDRRKPTFGPETKGYPTQNEERHIDRNTRRKLADIIDEVKEAKGEAVRGPSKFTTRLNSLAQPKKSYVQAMSEEYQTKYGRNVMSERLQRLASAGAGERSARGRAARDRHPAPPSPPPRHPMPSLPPLERGLKYRRPASASPEKHAPDAAPYKLAHAAGAPVTHFKNKMVAVESYVKNHYGRAAGADGGAEMRGAGKARVPLISHDMELSSLSLSSPTGEEATAIGNKLHHIINSMIMPKPPTLSALRESPENGSNPSQDDQFDDDDYHSRIENPSSVDSDFRADIFEDKNVKTAVQNFLGDRHEETVTDAISDISAFKHDDVEAINTAIELQELENALHRRMCVGAFSKRLRLKNLTITPKPSMQQMFLLQSGDADSLLLRSTISQTLKLSISRSISEKDICELQSLMQPNTNWNVTNIPMQITTVGYAFPQYNSIKCGSNSSIEPHRHVLKTDSHLPIKDQSLRDTPQRDALPDNNVSQNLEVNCDGGDLAAIDTNDDHTHFIQPSDKTESIPAILNVANTEEKKQDIEVANPVDKSVDKIKKLSIDGDLDHISYTSSLDILVGLLTEIQNITACHISNTESYIEDQDCKKLENILVNNSTFDCPVEVKTSRELISINSLDRLRHLDSNPSLYSMYISNDESEAVGSRCISNFRAVLCNEKPIYVDKEVTAEFPRNEVTSTFTDVPSLFPITITHSTNITDSLFEILSKPSTQTIFSINDSTSTYSDFSECQCKIVEIPQPDIECNEKLPVEVPCIADISKTRNVVMKLKNATMPVVRYNRDTRLLKNISVDRDPMLKMKRDILVTVYSMLVLTVFAALSFPDILYYA